MLHKFRTKSEVTGLPEFPDSVILEAERITAVLDTCYNRFGYDGGYVLIAENIADLQEVKAHHIDYTTEPPEVIKEINGFASVLYLPATEYSISLIMPIEVMEEAGIHEQV